MARFWNSPPVISTRPDLPTASRPSPPAPPPPPPAPPVWTTTRTWWPAGKRNRTTSKLLSWFALSPLPATPRDKQQIFREKTLIPSESAWRMVTFKSLTSGQQRGGRQEEQERNSKNAYLWAVRTQTRPLQHCSLASPVSIVHNTTQAWPASLLSASGSVFSKSWFSFIILQLYDYDTVRVRFIYLYNIL